MDTWADNDRLVAYYQRSGFKHVGIIDLDKTQGLPTHYKGQLALLEIDLRQAK